jgi:hypothetical protein
MVEKLLSEISYFTWVRDNHKALPNFIRRRKEIIQLVQISEITTTTRTNHNNRKQLIKRNRNEGKHQTRGVVCCWWWWW